MSATHAHRGSARPAGSTGSALRALRTRNFRLLWLGQLTSFSGSWMQAVAQGCVILSLTRSPLALGLLTVTQFAPALLLSLAGGVLADRLPKRRFALGLQSVMLAQAAVLALLVTTGRLELWHLYLLAALTGCASAIEIPTRQALVSELVEPELLPNALALNQMAATLAQIAGPLLGSLLAREVGPAACFWLNTASFSALLGSLVLMHSVQSAAPAQAAPERRSLRADLVAGLRHAARTPEVALALLLTGVLGTFGYIFSLVLPLVARDLLHTDPSASGLLTATIGAGSLAASLVLARHDWATPRAVLAGAGGFSLLLLATARLPGWGLTLPLLAGVGVFSVLFLTASSTVIQTATPPELRGRVMSIASLLSLGAKPLGALLIGAIAGRFGVQTALSAAALLCGAGTLVGLVFLVRRQATPVRRTEPAAARPRVAPAV
jgi:MFS family permease